MPDDDDDATRVIMPPSRVPRPAAPQFEIPESHTDRRREPTAPEFDSQPSHAAERAAPASQKKSNAPLIGGIAVMIAALAGGGWWFTCLLYTSPSPRDQRGSRMPSSA